MQGSLGHVQRAGAYVADSEGKSVEEKREHHANTRNRRMVRRLLAAAGQLVEWVVSGEKERRRPFLV